MIDNEYIAKSLDKYRNYLIPDLVDIITKFIANNIELHNTFLDKRIRINHLLEYISNHFDKSITKESFNYSTIIRLVLSYIEELDKPKPSIQPKEKEIIKKEEQDFKQLNLFHNPTGEPK